MNRLLSFLILLMLPAAALAFRDNGNLHVERRSYSGAKAGIYRLLLTDKQGTAYSLKHPARFLSRKGIILVNSAGNNGMGPWKKLSFPADAEDILTVGAVTSTLDNAPFSSVGPTQDGRVKPDLMAIGSPTHLLSGRGTLIEDMGTSFATPIICGLMACLWQALPSFTAVELMDLIRQSGSNCQHPDNIFGYGLPDFKKAYRIGRERESGTKGTR